MKHGRALQTSARTILLGLIALAPLVLSRLQDWEFCAASLAVSIAALLWVFGGGKLLPERWRAADVLLAFALALTAIASLFSVYKYDSLLYLCLLTSGMLAFLLARRALGSPAWNRAGWWTLCAGGFVAALWGLREYMTNAIIAGDPSWRAFGTFYNPNCLGGYMALVLLGAAALALTAETRAAAEPEARPKKGKRRREKQEVDQPAPRYAEIAGVTMALMMGLALLATGSKGALLAIFAGVIIFAWLAADGRTRLGRSLRLGAAALVGLAIIGALTFPPIRNRIAEAFSTQQHSGSFRVFTWQGTVEMIKARPLTGFGPGAFAHAYPRYARAGFTRQAHQTPLQLAAEGGVFTAAAVLAALLAVILAIMRGGTGGGRTVGGPETPAELKNGLGVSRSVRPGPEGRRAEERRRGQAPSYTRHESSPPAERSYDGGGRAAGRPETPVGPDDNVSRSGERSYDGSSDGDVALNRRRVFAAAAVAGAVGFWVHNMVDYTWFVAAPHLAFWVLLGLAWPVQEPEAERPQTKWTRRGVLAALAVLAGVSICLLHSEAQLAVGQRYAAMGAFGPAEDHLNKASWLNAQGWTVLSRLYESKGVGVSEADLGEAKRLRLLALDRQPTEPTHYSAIARILLEIDDLTGGNSQAREAVRYLKLGLEHHPTSTEMLSALGRVYEKLGEHDNALREYSLLVELYDTPVRTSQAVQYFLDQNYVYGFVWLAEQAEASGNHERAMELASRGASIGATYISNQRRYREMMQFSGRYDEREIAQIEALTGRAMALLETSDRPVDGLRRGIAFQKLGRYEAARDVLSDQAEKFAGSDDTDEKAVEAYATLKLAHVYDELEDSAAAQSARAEGIALAEQVLPRLAEKGFRSHAGWERDDTEALKAVLLSARLQVAKR